MIWLPAKWAEEGEAAIIRCLVWPPRLPVMTLTLIYIDGAPCGGRRDVQNCSVRKTIPVPSWPQRNPSNRLRSAGIDNPKFRGAVDGSVRAGG